jgi:hypothetical protein
LGWAATARLTSSTCPADVVEPAQRVSLAPGEALRLARALERSVDGVMFIERGGVRLRADARDSHRDPADA